MEKQIEIYTYQPTPVSSPEKIRGFAFDTLQEMYDWLRDLNIGKSAPSFDEISFGSESYFPKSALKKFNASVKVDQNADVVIEPWHHNQKLYIKIEHVIRKNNKLVRRGYEIRLSMNHQMTLSQQMKIELSDYQRALLQEVDLDTVEKYVIRCETQDEKIFEMYKNKYVVSDFVFWTHLSKKYGVPVDKEKCDSLKQMFMSEDKSVQKLAESMVLFYNWEGFEDELPLIMSYCGYAAVSRRYLKRSNSVFCNFFYHNCLCPPTKNDIPEPFNHFANCKLIKNQSFSEYTAAGKILLNKLAQQTVNELNEIYGERFYLGDDKSDDFKPEELSLPDRIIYEGVESTFKYLIHAGSFINWNFKIGNKYIRL